MSRAAQTATPAARRLAGRVPAPLPAPAPPPRKRTRKSNNNRAAAAPAPSPDPGNPGSDDDGEDDEDDDEDGEVGEKRKSTFDEPAKSHPLNKPGRHFGRTEEAFARLKPMLEFGLHYDIMEATETPVTDMTDEEIEWKAQYDALKELIPELRNWLDDCGAALVAVQLTQARKNARGEDAKKVKDYLHAMRAWTPTLVGLSKDQRGMHHPQIGDLIIPPYDRAVLSGPDLALADKIRQEYIHRVRVLDYELWPAFLYHNFKIYDHNIWRGAFKSHLLVLIAKLIFFGVRSLTPGAPIGGKCLATIWGMHEMTIGALCYVCTLGYFTLSSDLEFQPVPGVGGFSYKAFYDELKKSLLSQSEGRRTALLAWWNEQLFTNTHAAVIARPVGVKTAAELLLEQGEQADDDLLE